MNFLRLLFLTFTAILGISAVSFAQVPGFINRAATAPAGQTVLDPNLDGYTSATPSGFGTSDVTNSEIAYKGISAYPVEPNSDLRRGPDHSYTDFVPDSAGKGFYYNFSPAQNLLFRMRLGSIMPGSKGYSILMDTDGKFGATGPNADPGYLPNTSGTNGNPGFEIEIVLETNFRIAIYNVDNTSTPVMVKQYTNWQDMSQVSIASTNDNGDPDFLIDFYIPFSDLQAAPLNVTSSSSIRMTATTVMSPGAAIGGPRSDIYGVTGDQYDNFINAQPTCTVFNSVTSCSTNRCSTPPTVNSPISTGLTSVSGTWTKSPLAGAASIATILIYKNSVLVDSVINISSGNWTLPSISLVNGDIITAKTRANGESICLTSNAVAASSCNSTNRPATPILGCYSGTKGLSGSNLSTNWTVHVDNTTRATPDNNVTNATGLFGASTGSSPNINWVYSGGCSSGAPLASGSYKIYYTNNSTGCNSLPAYFCAAVNGQTALANPLTVPVITTPSNSVFTPAVDSIVGKTDPTASVTLYINTDPIQTVTAAADSSFIFPNLNLLVGQQLYIVTELNTGTLSSSKCAAQTAMFTVNCYTQTPLITVDANNQLTAALPITGTSKEVAGTTVRIYTAANALVATTAVQANGSWSTGTAGTTPAVYNAVAGTSYYANAQNGSCGVSGNSSTYAAASPTSTNRCGSITGTVTSGATSVSGALTGSFTSTVVNLYLDGERIGTDTTNVATWGPIPVNTKATNTLFPNGVLTLGIQETGKQEVICSAATQKIACTPSPVAPIYSPMNSTIKTNDSVTYTISNAVSGAFYGLADSATGMSLGMGKWATTNGSLTLTSGAFTSTGTVKVVVRSTSLNVVTLCSATSATAAVLVNSSVLPVTLLNFKGKKQASGNLLEWTTAAEDNVEYFDLERSSDGFHFESLGKTSATGNNSNYKFEDLTAGPAARYYRLKIVDRDGRFTNSNTVYLSTTESSVIITIAPNPFSSKFQANILTDKASVVTARLIDMTGKVLTTKTLRLNQGNNPVLFDALEGLAPGVYHLQVKTTNGLYEQKVLKVNL